MTHYVHPDVSDARKKEPMRAPAPSPAVLYGQDRSAVRRGDVFGDKFGEIR